MKLVAILRVKDEIRAIHECLAKLSTLVDEIIMLDNGSTDGTLEALKSYPKVKKVIHSQGYDEGRDKIMLLNEAKQTKADWIIWIDGDEVFEKHFTREVIESYMHSKYNRITFRMCNFWLSKERCIYDGQYYLYNLHPQRSMWRNMESAYFRDRKLHNGDIMGVTGKTLLSPYRIKHFGYVDKQKMQEKFDRYLTEDKTGNRDYGIFNDPDIPRQTYKFIEFESQLLNLIYILGYKYLCDILWYIERLRLKIFKT